MSDAYDAAIEVREVIATLAESVDKLNNAEVLHLSAIAIAAAVISLHVTVFNPEDAVRKARKLWGEAVRTNDPAAESDEPDVKGGAE